MKIILISCGKKKLPIKAIGCDLYVSSLFKKNLQYARSLKPDKIFILSANYGLIFLEEPIDPYDLTLNNMSSVEVKAWASKVLAQLKKEVDLDCDHFVFLAGDRYRKHLVPHLRFSEVPMAGLSIGRQLQFLKRALALTPVKI